MKYVLMVCSYCIFFSCSTTILGWLVTVSIGFNIAAASVRVSNELGAGHPKSCAFAVFTVTSTSFMISVISAILVFANRHTISYAFTRGEAVADAFSDLAPLVAVHIVLSGIQPVLSGVAVGCGWQSFVACVNVGCYYLVGIPCGVLLAFKFNLGAKGILAGLMAGIAFQTLILIWVTCQTNWEKEVEKARKRLVKWKDKREDRLAR